MGTVQGAPEGPKNGFQTISQLAEREGISKQAVSKKVKELVGLGLSVEVDGQGRVVAVDVADYDRLRAKTGNPSKAQAPGHKLGASKGGSKPKSDSYQEALRSKTWAQAEHLKLNLLERKRELVRVPALVEALGRCAAAIVTIVDRLPNSADEGAAAVAREGAHGLRIELKKQAARMRRDIADAIDAIAALAPEDDDDAA
jgi:biotin operon repressor